MSRVVELGSGKETFYSSRIPKKECLVNHCMVKMGIDLKDEKAREAISGKVEEIKLFFVIDTGETILGIRK